MRFNIEIEFWQDGTGRDSFGQPNGTPAKYLTAPAGMITTGGRELYAAQKVHAETSAVFKMWYEPGITEKMWIMYGTRRFEILSINNVDEQNQFLLISGKEAV